MVMSFRVSELQVLLGFAGRNKSGRKHELLTKALQLLKSGCSPAVQMKIKELYRRRFPRKILTPSDLSMLHLQTGQLPSATALTQGAMCHLPYNNGSVTSTVPAGMLPPVPMLGPKHEADVPHLSPPIHPVHPDVKMRRLPFYDVYDELIKPTTLGMSTKLFFPKNLFSLACLFLPAAHRAKRWLDGVRKEQLCATKKLLVSEKHICLNSWEMHQLIRNPQPAAAAAAFFQISER